MAIVACPDCNKDVSDSAPACPNCGRPNSKPVTNGSTPKPPATDARPVGVMLALGILVLPIVFAWFTLGKGRTSKARILAFGYLVLSIVFVSMQGGSSSRSSSTSSASTSSSVSAPAPEPAKEQAMQVGIGQILSDYKGNEVAADNRYKGRLIQVTGAVGDIKKDFTNNLYVTLGTGAMYELPSVQAFFDDSMNQQLGNLRKGQKITVVCRVKGLMMNVLAEDCFIK
ncbi:hypothetical protein ACIPIN_19360 [Pseudomonas sp. NPDC087697]|uniref:OB-fold protein n=1 Tax=Pseudomonas sp. NPDC087697 TaxID=3364447 RepID=UPI0038075DC5